MRIQILHVVNYNTIAGVNKYFEGVAMMDSDRRYVFQFKGAIKDNNYTIDSTDIKEHYDINDIQEKYIINILTSMLSLRDGVDDEIVIIDDGILDINNEVWE